MASKLVPHILDVTGFYDRAENTDEREFSLECPGVVAGQCGGWAPCEDPACLDDGEGASFHGVEHRQIDGERMTPTGECYFLTFGIDSLPDGAQVLRAPDGTGHGLDEGRYEVVPEYDGDGDWHFDLVAPVTA